MDKVIELDGKVNELISKYRDITNVGFDELDRVWKEIDEYRKEAHSAFQEYDSSIHRNENGRFTQASYNIAELAEFATKLDSFDNKCYDEIHRLHVEYQRKRDLYNQKNEERRILNLTNKRYALQISKLEARNKQLDAEISLRSGQFPDLVNMYEEEKKSNEALIENYRSSIVLFENRLKKYEKDLNDLKNGGELSFENDLEDDLENNKEEVENRDVSRDNTNKKPINDDDFRNGFVPNGPVNDDDFKNGYEDTKEKEDIIEPPVSPNVIPVVGDHEGSRTTDDEMPRELGDAPEDEEEEARELGDAPEDEEEEARELGDAPEDEEEEARELGDAPEDEEEEARELGDAPED
ncbi:MAG: hypothetical protein ACI33S_06420, partial [Bacilli bacterium]